jgi:DNA helicase-2/ATP-dependent DNA helicase PcrA
MGDQSSRISGQDPGQLRGQLPEQLPEDDPGEDIPGAEQTSFERVCASLDAAAAATALERRALRRGLGPDGKPRRFDDALVALRDEIGEARLEDVPALVAQMERLQEVSMTRAELQTVLVDRQSPYFGHLRLRERVENRGEIERDVYIGRATFTDPRARINIVDWRHAPVSQLYYRYPEGSDYEEKFGEREVEGDIVLRRTLTIQDGALLRIACPQGVWIRRVGPELGPGAAPATQRASAAGGPRAPSAWQRIDVPVHELGGGQGTATRPAPPPRPRGLLGAAPPGAQRLDRHLPEIAALIDPRQFEIMTARHAGVVVIQGGAGSGKTTIGLHRLAYLGFAYPERFPARRMLVVTHGLALAAYIDQVLPALGIAGVRVMTFREWAEKELRAAIPWIRATITEEAPLAVTRVKSHPAILHELERRAAAPRAMVEGQSVEAVPRRGARAAPRRGSRAVVELWADILTDRPLLLRLLGNTPEMPVSEADILEAHRFMVTRVNAIVSRDPRDQPHAASAGSDKPGGKLDRKRRRAIAAAQARDRAGEIEDRASPSALAFFGVSAPSSSSSSSAEGGGAGGAGKTVDSDLPEGIRRFESEREDFDDDENIRGEVGIDGLRTEDDLPILDLDDIAILLRAHQLVRRFEAPYAHLFVDEAQDLSPIKLAVLIGYTSTDGAEAAPAAPTPARPPGGRRSPRAPAAAASPPASSVVGRASGASGAAGPSRGASLPSITLAGDPAQKLFLDNGFGDWRAVLGHLGLAHVAVEPLRIAYRSTREILELARYAMGPLSIEAPSEARRVGAPVEAFRFPAVGAAVAFLAEALRELAAREPRATTALIARHPEQADRTFEGLRRAEVPGLRRVRAQDFTFRPGIEVTDVRQVKGLEFDYVIMLDANASSYGPDDESRHLFHIGVTRAAHQLWLIVTGSPSPLLPRGLLAE